MKTITTLVAVIAATCAVSAQALTQQPLTLAPQKVREWREDITFYRSALAEHHIDLYHTASKAHFDEELDRLVARLPELNEFEVVFEMMRITRLVGDGHTQFPVMAGPHQHFPLKFRIVNGDVRVFATSDAYGQYLGAELVSIDGVPIDAVLETLSPAVQPAENEYGLLHSLAFHLTVDNILYGAGITDEYGSARFVFATPDGQIAPEQINSVSMGDFLSQTTNVIERRSPFPEPDLALSDSLWLSTDQASRTAYLYFSSYPDLEDMTLFAQSVSRHLETNEIRNLIIDLRDNGGGDFYVGLALSSPILMTDSLDWNQGIYVLTGRATYSAAMTNAVHYRQLLNARLVGEPTGGNPVAYSELGSFHLPNSGRMVTFSERYYRLQTEVTHGVQPDVFIQPSRDDFLAGSDAALDWVLSDIGDGHN